MSTVEQFLQILESSNPDVVLQSRIDGVRAKRGEFADVWQQGYETGVASEQRRLSVGYAHGWTKPLNPYREKA